MNNNDFQLNEAGQPVLHKASVSRRFAKFDKVELLADVGGGAAVVVGTIEKVIDRGDMQYLLVNGETKSGIKVKVATYSADRTLQLAQTFG